MKEKYILFMKHVDSTIDNNDQKKIYIILRFIDSFKFLASLEKLALYLDKNKLREFFNLSAENFDLLTRKGIFPYEYVDYVKKLEEAELSSRKSFYNSLTGGIRKRLCTRRECMAILHSNLR